MTSSETFVSQAREVMRAHELETTGWWFEPIFPTDEPVRAVELGSGLVLPSPVVVHIDLSRRPSVDLRLEVRGDEFVVTQVTITPTDEVPGLTPTAIRSLPIKKLVDEAISRLARQIAALQEVTFAGQQRGYRFLGIDASGRIEVRPEVMKRRHRQIDDVLLREVAAAVRSRPAQRNQAVQERLFTSSRNATRWIAEAERRGFLNEEQDDV